jgi:hypothetical protein
MKMKVNHGDQCAVFAVYDEVVQNLAMETCPFMLEMVIFSSFIFFLIYVFINLSEFFFFVG